MTAHFREETPMSAIAATCVSNRPRRVPKAPAPPRQRILAVEFQSPDGRSWSAIGGGTTAAAAISYARESCPDGTTWAAVGWDDLYGE